MVTGTISDDQWIQYWREGYLRLGTVITPQELSALQQRIDDIMLGRAPVNYSRMLMQLDSETGSYSELSSQTSGHKGATLAYRKIQDLEYDPLFLSYMQKPLFREICGEVYGRHASISCYRAMFMNKPARKGTFLPWHQDAGDQWSLDRDPLVTVWLALDPATRANGCVQVVSGTHRLGLLSKLGHTITQEQERQYCPPDKIAYLELEPGEAVLLHNMVLHRSDVNHTDTPRRAFSVCYLDARTRQHRDHSFPVIFGEGALRPEDLNVPSAQPSSGS
ncbi:MAG: phytanoyl-CoA dioxygenase family protein [Armatimonadetes bacterium]|nr:phytanoyl-CoA dioxygenase family protein [Armatimonadota bacterium]